MHGRVGQSSQTQNFLGILVFCFLPAPLETSVDISQEDSFLPMPHGPELFQVFYFKYLFLLTNITPPTFDILLEESPFLHSTHTDTFSIIPLCSVTIKFSGKLRRSWKAAIRAFLRKNILVLLIIHFVTPIKDISQYICILMSESS